MADFLESGPRCRHWLNHSTRRHAARHWRIEKNASGRRRNVETKRTSPRTSKAQIRGVGAALCLRVPSQPSASSLVQLYAAGARGSLLRKVIG